MRKPPIRDLTEGLISNPGRISVLTATKERLMNNPYECQKQGAKTWP